MADLEQPGSNGSTRTSRSASIPSWLRGGLGVIVAALAAMWLIEIVDTIALDDRLEANGIRPRSTDGLDGILWSPFLHGGFRHLIGNTVPFAILSALALTGGLRRYLTASAVIIVVGGALVWALAIGSNENHIGASGWVFGLFGFLIAAAVFEKRAVSIIVAIVALFIYGGTILFGFVPRPGLSWEGHLFGFIAGVVAARVIASGSKKVTLDGTTAQ